MKLGRFFLAYLCSALIGALAFMLVSSSGVLHLSSSSFFFLVLIAVLGGVLVAPVAIPAIAYSDANNISHWAYFTGFGVMSSIVIVLLMAESITLQEAAAVAFATTSGALTFWLVSRKIFRSTRPTDKQSKATQ